MASTTRSNVALLYRRAGFGLRSGELDQVAANGYDAAVDTLLAGLGSAPDPTGDLVPLPVFSPYRRPATPATPATRATPAAPATPATPAAPQAAAPTQTKVRNQEEAKELAALQRWWIDRMIATSTPLREKLTLFWHGHFATGASKVHDAKLMYLQNQLFRAAGSGSFEQLTQAVAKDGAMMVWLDTGTDKRTHPNENFSREMMELFTLGIGNYTQDDVTAAARGFTGWIYDRVDYRYGFRPRQHDFGAKTYLGQTGDWNGEDIVHIAVTRPESARFVLAKLWSHFAYPVSPSDQVVSDLLPAYGPDLNIGTALRAMFLHPAFLSGEARVGLVKQPIEYLAGAARTLGLDATLQPSQPGQARTGSGDTDGTNAADPRTSPGRAARTLPTLATALGQTPFNPPNVGGWGQNAYWLDTATANLRLEIALLLASRADLTSIEALPQSQRVAGVANLLAVDGWGQTTATALAEVAGRPVQLTALALAAPEYVLA